MSCPHAHPFHYCETCPVSPCPIGLGSNAATPEPPPIVQPDKPTIVDLVIADFNARAEFGLAKYGTKLQARNGRDALMDLYQELIDAVMYCRQMIEERDECRT